MIASMTAPSSRLQRYFIPILALLAVFVLSGRSQTAPTSDAQLLAGLTADFDSLAPQTIRPADGFITRPFLVPAGYYPQMWDWDGFFIGSHWANQSPEKAVLLRDWVLNFAASADADGYVAGCITTKGPRPLFGKFAMKPFLAQGAVVAAGALHDYEWIRPAWPAMQRILGYRKKTQFDEHWNLWFWDNAMQSGADNNPALTNEENDRSAILAVDASVWAMREYEAMAQIARKLGDSDLAPLQVSRPDQRMIEIVHDFEVHTDIVQVKLQLIEF